MKPTKKKRVVKIDKDGLFAAIVAICKDYNDKHLKTNHV